MPRGKTSTTRGGGRGRGRGRGGSVRGRNSNYKSGIRAENKVAQAYKAKGYNVKQSPGSRGINDLTCKKGNTTHYVQVKSSKVVGRTPHISPKDVGRLKSTSTRNNATSVIAKVNASGKMDIKYAKGGRRVFK